MRKDSALGAEARVRSGPALAAVTLVALLVVLSACGQPETELSNSDASASTGSSSGDEASEGVPAEPEVPADKKKKRSLKGGGFASAAPGTDAPDRKDDTGPVIPISAEAPNIKEIERLVREVEKLTQAQNAGEPVDAGGSLTQALGTFSYRYYEDGSLDPDPKWVAGNITTEQVPILGSVNGHRVMLPQLRASLQEVVDRGLADEINPEEYAGCYVPRFIASDPSNGLSLHSWGIAVDLNVPGNLRGTVGEMDRTVVAIFKKWGFAWGGDWNYTDPMHFELARLVEAR